MAVEWDEGFSEALLDATRREGIAFSEEQARQCALHIALMLEWNQRLNLTRIEAPREILVKHLLDSLIPARWLPEAGAALDVGTGPGFPGIPLKILHPGLEMVLLEAHRKKVSFLKVAIARLGLAGLYALQTRWEELHRVADPLAAKRYDLITLRAVRLEAAHLDRLAPQCLNPGGRLAWWAGPGTDAPPLHRQGGEMGFVGRFLYDLPTATRPRRLLVWEKQTA